MRVVDPFAYWARHASAIEGLGGDERSPDPRYLFHTHYHDVRAGRARFVVTLAGVRASFGELSIRVHAWKPDSDGNVSLVSGARTLLQGENGAEMTLPVQFAPQKGVRYALYGYLSEDSDVTAHSLRVAIDEAEDAGDLLPEPPRSVLAMNRPKEETRPANALIHYGPVAIEHPVSQSCTAEQLAALGLTAKRALGRESATNDAALARWSETLCVNALATYGATQAGLEGLIVGPFSVEGAQHLARSAATTRLEGGSPPPRESGEFFDFLLMPGGIETGTLAGADERWDWVAGWLARLKIGGLAALGLRYRPDGDLVSSSVTADARALTRNEIGQWSLKLISRGYSMAPTAFAPQSDLVVDGQGLAGFVMIIQRL